MAYTYTSSVNSTGNSAIKFRMGYEVVSQGINGGVPQSVLNVCLQTERTNTSTTNKQSAATTMTIDGVQSSKSLNYNVASYTQNTWYTIWTISDVTVNHDAATGAKTLTLAFTINLSGTSATGASGSWSDALPVIPMGSTLALNATSYTISNSTGPTATATITRYNTSYYHQLVWKLGSTTIATQNAGQVASATRALTASAWLPNMTTSASAQGSCTLKTYSDSGYTTQVGVDSVVTFTVVCTRNPSIGTVSVATNGGISNVWVGGYSKADVTAATVAGINGSTITKYEFLVNNAVAATYSSSASTYTWTSGILNAGSYTFAVRVTDSRGRTATKSATAITVLQYASPAISAISIFRCNSGGTAAEDGTYISVKATATATPTGNSISTFNVFTKLSTASTWTDKGALTSGTVKLISTYAATSTWNVKLEATDALGTKSTYTTTIPTASYTMDFKVGGLGVAFGKVAEQNNLVDSQWDIKSAGTFIAGSPIALTSGGTGADNALDARQNLGIQTQQYNLVSGTARTFDVPAGTRHLLVVIGSVVTNNYGIWVMASTSSGATTLKEIVKGSGVTISVSGQTVTATSTTYGSSLLDWALAGTIITPHSA